MQAPHQLVSDDMMANPVTVSPHRVMEGTPVSRIMIQNPITVTAETPLLEAAETLCNTRYGALPVVSGGHVVGILTDNDLVHALVDCLRGEKPGEKG